MLRFFLKTLRNWSLISTKNLAKHLFIIYVDIESLIEKIDVCKNNPENLSTTKVDGHVPSDFSMSAISSFKIIENKHDVYRGTNCTKKFCESL